MDVYAELALILDRTLSQAAGQSVYDRVMHLAVAYVDYVQANEKLWANLLEFRRQYRDSNVLAVEAENALFGVLEAELDKLDGVDGAGLRADLARALWASVHGITVQTVPNSFKEDPRGDALEQMRLIIDAVITRYSS
ncbi:TetR-like C-terminal domain-containing protein [Maricaulis sp.]|nr:TetR-like C-terminal domain-containing protein [Maricaulis sp.]